jgi:hypothetical protein
MTPRPGEPPQAGPPQQQRYGGAGGGSAPRAPAAAALPPPLWRPGSGHSFSGLPGVASLAAGPSGSAGSAGTGGPSTPRGGGAGGLPPPEPRTPVGSPLRLPGGTPGRMAGGLLPPPVHPAAAGSPSAGAAGGEPTAWFSPRSGGRGERGVQYSDRFIPSRAAHARLDFSPMEREIATAAVNRSAAEREVRARRGWGVEEGRGGGGAGGGDGAAAALEAAAEGCPG